MRTAQARVALLLLGLVSWPVTSHSQPADTIGTRAQGMANAFVGVADDASAVYWNPAGLAAGAFFSLVLDGAHAEATPDDRLEGGRRSGWLLAASMPALGLTYYRLGRDTVTPVTTPEGPGLRREALVTHHVGATLVQSLTDHIAVGATLKSIRGIAGAAVLPTLDRRHVLREMSLIGQSSTRVDVDAGIMATGFAGSLGLVARNLVQPFFPAGAAPAGAAATESLRLDRQVRVGGSVTLLPDWRLASDLDLTRQQGPFGDVREWAVGTEARLARRVTGRGGVRINTVGAAERSPALSVGASYAVFGAVLLDGQVTLGSDPGATGWGLAARMVF
jgi:hypothetical protein